jgi:2-polyprenyl-3-methyl-5-hydroxy-6-metoxy-1,4-benzoquinol methylase
MERDRQVKGWFSMPGRPGDRHIDQQLLGLQRLLLQVKDKSILDVGCAEGLIALELEKAGARAVHGVEIVQQHVEVARALTAKRPVCSFECADANDWMPRDGFDITLMLAVLHKLRNPTEAARRFARVTRDMCVIRLPPATAPIIVDERSGGVPHDIAAVMSEEGFNLVDITRGAFDEWCGYYRRMT